MRQTIQVLLIEDNPGEAERIRLSLTEETSVDFKIVRQQQLADAGEYLQGSNPDVILLDLDLPGYRGFDDFKQRLKMDNAPPIVVMTSRSDREVGLAAIQAGAQDAVVKGDESMALLPRILQHAFERHQYAMKTQAPEKDLMESESTLSKIFDLLPVGLWFADKEGKLLRGNPAGIKIWGAEPHVSPAEYGIFKSYYLPSHQPLAPNDWALVRTIQNGETILEEQLEIEAFDGEKKIILNYTAPVLDGGGNLQGAIILNEDITQRYWVEQQLQQNEASLRALINAVDHSVFLMELDGTVVSINQTTAQRLGSCVDDMIGTNIYQYVPDAVANLRRAYADQVIAQAQPVHFLDQRSGRWIENSIYPVIDAQGRVVRLAIYGKDVTDRKQAEIALQERERELSTLMDNLPGMAYRCYNDANWTMVLVSQGCLALTGYPAEALVQNHLLSYEDLTHGEDRERVRKTVQSALAVGQSYEFEYRIQTKSGEIRWVWERGSAVPQEDADQPVLEGFIMDITRRVEAQVALRMNEERYRTVISSADEAFILQERSGAIVTWNAAAERIFGLTAAEALGQTSLSQPWRTYREDGSFLPGAEHPSMHTFATGEPCRNVLVKIVRDDDSFSWVHISTNPVFFAEGNTLPDAVVITVQDITEQRHQQQALLESEARFRRLYEQSPSPYQALNEEGLLLEVNAAWLTTLGYQKKEVLGHYFGDFLAAQDSELFPRRFEHFKRVGEVHGVEFCMQRQDQTLIDVSFDGRIVRDAQGKMLQTHCVFTNITERKHAETVLRQSAEDLKKAQSVAHVGSWKWHIPTNALTWSDEMYVIFGMNKDDFTGNLADVMASVIHPDDRPAVEASNLSVIEQGKPVPLEYRVIHPDGSVRTLWAEAGELLRDEAGNPQVLSGIVQDITERKAAEAQLLLQDSALKAAANAVVITDMEGTIEWANPAFTTLTGYSQEESNGKNLHELVKSGMQDDAYYVEMWQMILAGKVWRGEFTNRRKDGSLYDESISITPIFDHLGKITQFVAIKEDITLRKQQEQRLLRQAHIQERLVAMGRALGATVDIHMIYRVTYRYVREIVDVPNLGITLYDPDHKKLHLVFAVSDGQVIDVDSAPAFPYAPDDPQMDRSRVIATQQTIIANDLAAKMKAGGGVLIGDDDIPPQSAIYVPMVAEGKSIGVLDLQSYQKDVFTVETGEWLSVVANQVALAIQNARLYEQVRKRVSQLNSLREIDAAINAHQPLVQIFDLVLNQVRYHLGMDAAAILLLNPENQILEYQAGYGFQHQNTEKIRVPLGASLAGKVAETQKMIQSQGCDVFDTFLFQSGQWVEEGFQDYIGVPVRVGDVVSGVVEVFHRSKLSPNPDWLQYLETLAGQAAIAIDNQVMFSSLQNTAEELLQAYDATIEGWSRAMDLRDRETEGHTQRVTELTMKLAKAAGVSTREMVHVRRGALLHDMGKLGIPDRILLKPGRLDQEEWALMQQHPQMAFNMLEKVDYLRPALDIPHYHHEKWDGSGYPDGLRGEEIPFSARIFALADVWDAVTNERPYKEVWSEEKAKAHLRQQSGIHFDPTLVELFLDILEGNERRTASE